MAIPMSQKSDANPIMTIIGFRTCQLGNEPVVVWYWIQLHLPT